MDLKQLAPGVLTLAIFMALTGLAACSSDNKSTGASSIDAANKTNAQATGSSAGTNPAQMLPANVVASSVVASGAAADSLTANNSIAKNTPASDSNSATAPPPNIAVNDNSGGGTIALSGPPIQALVTAPPEEPLSEKGAFRLLQQASFGATEAGIQEAMVKGPRRWLAEQFAMPVSTYGYRDRDAIHTWNDRNSGFCDQFAVGTTQRDNCWRDWYSSDLIKLDFFKHASLGTDQLRQRIAFALSQIVVTSEVEVQGVYGLADYQQSLREVAFKNYRDVLLVAATHPVMGQYLNMVDNDANDPNENFARELLQLFSIGTCLLNADGTLKSGKCEPTYNNDMVREYAHALTGWTFPVGGINPWCSGKCDWKNPTYLKGKMVAVETAHDKVARSLLNGTNLSAGHNAPQALNAVLDSLMNHPNIAPFISKQLIQFFVTSNPSPAYVGRVAVAFMRGQYEIFGSGTKGDLMATIAAILLDPDARQDSSMALNNAGKLREPVIMMVNAIRALNGYTDGERMGRYGWGSSLSQPLFNSPSVFNFYSPDYPLPGNPGLVAPQLQLINANTSLGWINFANDLVYWWYNKNLGIDANAGLLGSTGTRVSYSAWEGDAGDSTKLVDRLDRLITGGKVGSSGRAAIATALSFYTPADTWLSDANTQSSWQRERVRSAVYLLLASPHYQVQR